MNLESWDYTVENLKNCLFFILFYFFLSLLGEHSSREDIKPMLSLKNQCARYWIWHSKACTDIDHKDVALLKI